MLYAHIAIIYADVLPDGKQVFWMTIASVVSVGLSKGWEIWSKYKQQTKTDKVEEEANTIKRYDDLLTRIGVDLNDTRKEAKEYRQITEIKIERLTIQVERYRGQVRLLMDIVKRHGIQLDAASFDTPIEDTLK